MFRGRGLNDILLIGQFLKHPLSSAFIPFPTQLPAAMLRSIPKHIRIPSRSTAQPARAILSLSAVQRHTQKRSYAAEAVAPSKNDAFANGGNAYYTEE